MRLLVVVSGDYGELGTAMYFLNGLRSAQRPVLLLPESLAHTMATTPEREVRTYADLDGVRRVIIEARPEAAMLASGYLLPINSGLSLLDSIRLLRFLRRRRVALLTSDPFLGLLGNVAALDFRSLYGRASNRPGAFAASWRNICRLFLMRRELRRAWHIYPAPTERMHPRPDARRLSYFNAAAPCAPRCAAGDREQPPAWLFVLSKTDFEMHLHAQGDRFVAQAMDRLEDSVALGRNTRLIGPRELADAVRARLGTRVGITSHGDTTYASYMRDLMAAEYVFFWNFYSFSVIHRVLANRPIFFFDEGHMVHILPAIRREGIRLYYDGWRPSLLPMDVPLDEQDLAGRALETTAQFRRIADGLRGCPSPAELLQHAASRP